jgi:hypothetical protein
MIGAQLTLNTGPRPVWTRIDVEDPRGAELADCHYSRQTIGAAGYMPPGLRFALWHEPAIGAALWGVCYNLDPIGAPRWRNTIFHNASVSLSSWLIEHATVTTYEVWIIRYKVLPSIPLTTEIDVEATRARRSRRHEPGHCYRIAGWREVARFDPGHGRPERVVLEAPAP